MRKTRWVWGLLLSLTALAGCGGGGGGDGGGGPPGGNPPTDVGFLRSAGGTAKDDAYAIATYADGSSVVTGAFGGTATWGAGEADETTLTATGPRDIFVARYHATGALAWAKRAGGLMVGAGYGIASVPDGSCIVTGTFQDAATFGLGEPNATTLDDIDDLGDVFVARYEPDGTLAWAKRAGRNGSDVGAAISAHPDGSSVITGSYDTIAVFGPGETNATILNAAGAIDIFVAAYHPSGELAWARSAGGTSTDRGTGIAILSDGASLVTGYYSEPTATFGPGDPNQITMASAGIFDAFVARYNSDGTLAWVRSAGGSSFDQPSALSAFADESFVVGGFFRDAATFGAGEPNQTTLTSLSGSNDLFVARYAANGSLVWARQAGGADHGDSVRGIAALPDGTCALAGNFQGVAVFDPGGPNESFRVAEGGIDLLVAHYGTDGAPLWIRTAGGAGDDRGFGVAAHADGSLAACGSFVAPAVVNPGQPDETNLAGPGNWDLFVARYDTDGSL